MRFSRNPIALAVTAYALTATVLCLAAELTVDTLEDDFDSPAGATLSLREAIRDAAAGDTIRFAPDLNGGVLLLTKNEFLVTKDLTIDAMSLSEGITVDGNDTQAILTLRPLTATVPVMTVRGIKFARGRGLGRAVLENEGKLTLENCQITACTTNLLPALLNRKRGPSFGEASLALRNCSLTANKRGAFDPEGGGAMLLLSGHANLLNCTLEGNESATSSAISMNAATVLLSYCTVANNRTASTPYSAISVNGGGTLTLLNSVVAGNLNQTASSTPAAVDIFNQGYIQTLGTNFLSSNAWVGFPPGPTVGTPEAPLDAKLGAARPLGGRVLGCLPLPGSALINRATGSTPGVTTDSRGVPRGLGGSSDLGAVEVLPVDSLLVDTDADGMDDRLEPSFGFTVGTADGAGDADGDGWSNAEELAHRTHPHTGSDFPRVISLQHIEAAAGEEGPLVRVT